LPRWALGDENGVADVLVADDALVRSAGVCLLISLSIES
jgi:hypothetical protein